MPHRDASAATWRSNADASHRQHLQQPALMLSIAISGAGPTFRRRRHEHRRPRRRRRVSTRARGANLPTEGAAHRTSTWRNSMHSLVQHLHSLVHLKSENESPGENSLGYPVKRIGNSPQLCVMLCVMLCVYTQNTRENYGATTATAVLDLVLTTIIRVAGSTVGITIVQ